MITKKNEPPYYETNTGATRVWRGRVAQTGTGNILVQEVLTNTLGGEVTFTRNGVGAFIVEGNFAPDYNTEVQVDYITDMALGGRVQHEPGDGTYFFLQMQNAAGGLDGVMVYPAILTIIAHAKNV